MGSKPPLCILRCGVWLSKTALLACLLISQAVQAASLGRLSVFSMPGQPLKAEVEILSPPPADKMSSLLVELGSREDFQLAGIEYAPELRFVQLALVDAANGLPLLRLTSSRPLTTPVLNFLLTLRWAGGRQVREFTLNLETGPSASIPPQGSVPQVTGSSLKPGSPISPPDVAAPVRQVRPGETLYQIAAETKPPELSVEQMLWGLYRRNPDAFEESNLHRLRAGSVLQMPDPATLRQVGDEGVRKMLLAHERTWESYLQTLAADTPGSRGAGSSRERGENGVGRLASGKLAVNVELAPPPVSTQDRVSIAPVGRTRMGREGDATEEALIAERKALQEASARIALLEKNVALLEKLLEAKEAALAQATRAAPAPLAVPAPVQPLVAAQSPRWLSSTDLYFWLALLSTVALITYVLIRRQRTLSVGVEPATQAFPGLRQTQN